MPCFALRNLLLTSLVLLVDLFILAMHLVLLMAPAEPLATLFPAETLDFYVRLPQQNTGLLALFCFVFAIPNMLLTQPISGPSPSPSVATAQQAPIRSPAQLDFWEKPTL